MSIFYTENARARGVCSAGTETKMFPWIAVFEMTRSDTVIKMLGDLDLNKGDSDQSRRAHFRERKIFSLVTSIEPVVVKPGEFVFRRVIFDRLLVDEIKVDASKNPPLYPRLIQTCVDLTFIDSAARVHSKSIALGNFKIAGGPCDKNEPVGRCWSIQDTLKKEAVEASLF
jgi:hypothetical protein